MRDSKDNTPRVNSLRAGPRQVEALLDALDKLEASSEPGEHPPAREFVRWRFRRPLVEVQVTQPSGQQQTLLLVSRNLSRQGVAALHSSFVYPNTPCRVVMRPGEGGARLVPGRVVRCEHRGGNVHELGIRFDAEISTKELLGLDPIDEGYSIEKIEPDRLQGTVLIVTGGELDEQLIIRMLEDTSLLLNTAQDDESVRARIAKGCDLLLIDGVLRDGASGIDMLSELRGEGFDAPAVVMTDEASEATRGDARMAGANGVVSKPISQQRLLQAAEFLVGEGDGGPIFTTLRPGDAAWDLLGKYLGDLPRMLLDLEAAMRSGDHAVCERVCHRLMSTAEPMGFAEIGRLARRALKAMGAGPTGPAGPAAAAGTPGPRQAGAELRALMIACRRIRFRAA